MTRLQMIKAALHLCNVAPAEKIVLMKLASVANQSCTASMAQSQIARLCSLSLSTVEKSMRALSYDGYILREQKFNKTSGYRLVDSIKLQYAKSSFIEPSKKTREKARITGWPPVKFTGHYIYRKLPSGLDANFVAKSEGEKALANELKLIVGGKS